MSNQIKYPTEEEILKEANVRQLDGAEPYSFAGGARWVISQIKSGLLIDFKFEEWLSENYLCIRNCNYFVLKNDVDGENFCKKDLKEKYNGIHLPK